MKKLINMISEIISLNGRIILAVDGCCASGKTTLAGKLSEQFNAQVIHMDDFFLPAHMRTSQRLSQAGGIVHHERFCREVVEGIKSGKPFKYGIYSCNTETTYYSETILPEKSIIIEGAYALHPEIPDIYDLKVFLETDRKTQLERILIRNGSDALETFKNKWIPFENKYFEEFNIKDKCDLLLNM